MTSRKPLEFADCAPWLLTPKLLARRRGGTFIAFGGCGFMLFLWFAYAMLVLMAVSITLMWDMGVVVVFGIAMGVEQIIAVIKRRRSATAA